MGVLFLSVLIHDKLKIFLVITIIFFYISFFYIYYLLNQPLSIKEKNYYLELKPNTSLSELAYHLKQEHILNHPRVWVYFSRLLRKDQSIKSGEYLLKPGTSSYELLNLLVKGDRILHSIRFLEGWNFLQVREALAKNLYCQHTLKGKKSKDILQILNLQPPSLEGQFFPDTYLFFKDEKDIRILRQAAKAMKKHLKIAWQFREKNLPYESPYQGLILASLIEKEAYFDSDRAKVAGVFIRRLKKGMRLQTDAAMIYALGKDLKGSLQHKHLKLDSPYNTYKHSGLPPTPIALVSEASLYAAFHPDKSELLYFVTKKDRHLAFAEKFQRHRDHIKKLLIHDKLNAKHRVKRSTVLEGAIQ